MRLLLRTLSSLVLIAGASLTSRTFAQSHTDAAKELFDRGLNLMDEGRHRSACRMLEESQRLDAGMGTQYWLAECYEHTGRLASARALFLDVAAAAARAGQTGREKIALGRAAALSSRVPHVIIAVTAGAPSPIDVALDGKSLPTIDWSAGKAVDLGEHEVKATLSDGSTWVTTFQIRKDGERMAVEVPTPKRRTALPASAESLVKRPRMAPGSSIFDRHKFSILSGGAALALAGVGVGLGAQTLAHRRELFGSCGVSVHGCTQDDMAALRREATATTVLFVGAGIAAAIAVLFLLVEPLNGDKKPAPKAAASGDSLLVRF